MQICLAQINTTPGDFSGNWARIRAGILRAKAEGCSAIVFPELAIPGYLSQDLMYHEHFLAENTQVLNNVIALSGESGFESLHIVVGYLEVNMGPGKPFYNSAAVILGGRQIANHRKLLLPFYDVFDEQRYFEPGQGLTIIELGSARIGIAICEDLWNDKGEDHYAYKNNPLARYREAGVDGIFSLNSSPYVHGKLSQRLTSIGAGLGDMALFYVNQWGGQDELVFDGQSLVVESEQLVYISEQVKADEYAVVTCLAADDRSKPVPIRKPRTIALYDLLVLSLKDYVDKSGFEHIVLASSGGIDSALVAQIACDAVGAKQVHAIRMPSIYSTSASSDDAKMLHENLGCWDYEVPIEHQSVIKGLNQNFSLNQTEHNLVSHTFSNGNYNEIADQNMQARLRDLYVMHFSNAFGAMPLSTGNKTESACGYYTHFDMNFSFAPIKDLYKRQVFELAQKKESIPRAILEKPPSAELAPNQTDEASLLPYAILDPLVQAYIENYINQFDAFSSWVSDSLSRQDSISLDEAVLSHWLEEPEARDRYPMLIRLIASMEYKRRQTCPGPKVSKVAFGMGRRIPIVKKFS